MDDGFDGILSRDQIRTLIGVAEQGSFHRAAARLGVQQPAVNQLIRRLEERLDRRLFDRSPQGATLTIDGEAVLIYARAMAKLGQEMSRHLSRPETEIILRIGIGEEFGRTALPSVLALFARLHRNFRFEALSTSPSEAMFEILDAGRLDVVVARRHPDAVRGEVVYREPTVWTARRDFPRPISDPIPLVLPTSGVLRSMILDALSRASRSWHVAFEGGNYAVLEAAVRAGLGITACTASLDLGELTAIDEKADLPQLPASIFVLERSRPPRSAAVEAFCDVLQTSARLSFNLADTSRAELDSKVTRP